MPDSTVIFVGHLVADQPLATCPPGLPTGGENAPKPVPAMPVMVGGVRENRLYFPAAGLRGKLRRAAVDVVRRAIAQGGDESPFTLEDHYYLTLGGVKGNKKEDKGVQVLAIAEQRNRNPLVSLFGSGAPWMAGRLSVGHAVATTSVEPAVFSGVRTDDLARNPDGLAHLQPGEHERFLASAAANHKRSHLKACQREAEARKKKARKDNVARAAAEAEIADLTRQIDDLSAVTVSSVSVGQILDGFEAIPAGCQLDHQMVVRNGTDVEVGLFLAALEEFAAFPRIGAHHARGCGQVSGSWDVRVGRPGQGFRTVGRVTLHPFSGLDIEQAPSETFLGMAQVAWAAAAERMTVADVRSPVTAGGRA